MREPSGQGFGGLRGEETWPSWVLFGLRGMCGETGCGAECVLLHD